MIKLYEEHPEFDAYTRFDTTTGRLESLSEQAFGALAGGRSPSSAPVTVFSGNKPETHTRFPRRVYFQITRNCNLACAYCYIKSRPGDPHVPTQTVLRMADFLGRSGLMEVRLTGGEPTTHPEFFKIMERFRDAGVYVSVASNGLWSARTLEGLCEEAHLWVICSVDGPRAMHDRYRPGTFDRIVANLSTLKNKNPTCRIRLTCVLTQENRRSMHELGCVGAAVGAESITVIPLRPQVRDPGVRALMVTAAQFRQVLEDMVRAREKTGVPFTTTIETDYKSFMYPDPIVRKRSACAAGREATNLDYDASTGHFIVYACSYSPASDPHAPPALRSPFMAGEFPADEIERFGDIWDDEPAWALYRDLSIRPQPCRSCHYLERHLCTGACPIQNIDYGALDVEGSVLGQLREQIVRTGEWYCYQNVLHQPDQGT